MSFAGAASACLRHTVVAVQLQEDFRIGWNIGLAIYRVRVLHVSRQQVKQHHSSSYKSRVLEFEYQQTRGLALRRNT